MTVLVVAEAGQCRGSVGYAIEAMRAAQAVGCWGVKVQLLQPETIAQPRANVYWDERRPGIKTQRDTFAAVGCLDYHQVTDLVAAAQGIGVELFATPFDLDGVETMAKAGMGWCKIASGDITHAPLLEAAARAFPGRLIVSTGASTLAEVERATQWILDASSSPPAALLACSLVYPTPWRQAELGRIVTLRRAVDDWGLNSVAGYSDHTHGWAAAGPAVGAGARMLEKHFGVDADPSVPDSAFALEPGAMRQYVAAAQAAEAMMGTGGLGVTEAEQAARVGARRVVCATVDVAAGDTISEASVTWLRPATPDGFEPWETSEVVGRVARHGIRAGLPVLRSVLL